MKQTVLIVEDDDDLRRMFRTALTFGGFDSEEAGDGYTALHLVDQQEFAAVVLDLGLPMVSGYLVLQDLAARATTRNIPVIIVTGIPGPQPAGAACLLRKPVLPDQLVNTVRACILEGARAAIRQP